MENLMAAAKLRLIETGSDRTAIRLVDFMSIIPSITGKIELVYEGEQEGADEVAKILIDNAVIKQFEKVFPRIPKLEKNEVKTPYTDLINWFDNNFIELNYTDTDSEFYNNLKTVTPLLAVTQEYASTFSKEDQAFCMELVLWGLTINNKLDKSENDTAYKFDSTGISQFFHRNN
jgi:magnesium chelatase subunit I